MTTKSIKKRAISGFVWSFSDSFVTQLVQFLIGLILARLLSPTEFGLVGMVTVFLSLSQSLVDSGFDQALIRKNDANDRDYSTVFYFNMVVGLLFSLGFFFIAPLIARFYNSPELVPVTRVLGVIIVINATTITQRTILIKRVDFKLQMKINLAAAVISGAVAIFLAYKSYGVWSLVWRSIISSAVQSVLLWSYNRWLPRKRFSWNSFNNLFAFGSKLLISGLIDTLYRNIYLLVIGKFFSARDLGFFTRADQFSRLPSQNITGTIQRVSYPILSMLQDDNEKLKAAYTKLIYTTMYVSFICMLGMAAMAKPLILALIGEKWLPSVLYLQILCVGGMLYPLHALNLNMLNVKGRSDLFLKLELIKKILAVPVIVIGIAFGITPMLIGMSLLSFVAYFINSYYSGNLINYTMKEQIYDILPSFLLSLAVSAAILCLPLIISLRPFSQLLLQGFLYLVLILSLSEAFKLRGYLEIRGIVFDKLRLKH